VVVTVERRAGAVIVRVTGEMDLPAAPLVRRRLQRAIAAAGGRTVVVDLTRVSFLDSSGLGVLLGGFKQCERWRRAMVVVAGDRIRSLLELAGIPRLMPVYRTLREALGTEKT